MNVLAAKQRKSLAPVTALHVIVVVVAVVLLTTLVSFASLQQHSVALIHRIYRHFLRALEQDVARESLVSCQDSPRPH